MGVLETHDEQDVSKTLVHEAKPLSKAEKKRRQNRLNQIAYRQREAEKAAVALSRPLDPAVALPKAPIQVLVFKQRTNATNHKGRKLRISNGSYTDVHRTPVRSKTKQTLYLSNALVADSQILPLDTTHVTSVPENARVSPDGLTKFVLQELSSLAYDIAVPKQIYWEWAIQHPDTMTEDEIRELQNIGGLAGFNLPKTKAFRFPLSSDHKIMIVQYNLYRAMKLNKQQLSPWLVACPGVGVLPNIPDGIVAPALQPTALQQVLAHPSWIAIFPHPRVRDNIILRQNDVCWDEMLKDLSGYLYPCHTDCDRDDHNHQTEIDHIDPSDIATAGHGLIVWGEPFDVGSWELTPGFIRKWKWLLKGCQDMVITSNRWRALRHEPPILEVLD